jgi:hypothetical protein
MRIVLNNLTDLFRWIFNRKPPTPPESFLQLSKVATINGHPISKERKKICLQSNPYARRRPSGPVLGPVRTVGTSRFSQYGRSSPHRTRLRPVDYTAVPVDGTVSTPTRVKVVQYSHYSLHGDFLFFNSNDIPTFLHIPSKRISSEGIDPVRSAPIYQTDY